MHLRKYFCIYALAQILWHLRTYALTHLRSYLWTYSLEQVLAKQLRTYALTHLRIYVETHYDTVTPTSPA